MGGRRIFQIMAICLCFYSCTDGQLSQYPHVGAVTAVHFRISPSFPAYKAARNVQILVFDSTGTLSAYRRADDSSSVLQMNVNTGRISCHAVLNAPEDYSMVRNREELMDGISLLEDNMEDSMVMWGETMCEAGTETSEIQITAERLLSRIKLEKITAAFNTPAHQKMKVMITGIYLINVCGCCTYREAPVSGGIPVWYNRQKFEDSPCNGLTSHPMAGPFCLQDGSEAAEAFTDPIILYCCPNPTMKDSHDRVWSPRYTRLVVETTLDGIPYFYPVTIPHLRRNTSYQISELKITDLGVPSPDMDLEERALSCNITIRDWNTGENVEFEY